MQMVPVRCNSARHFSVLIAASLLLLLSPSPAAAGLSVGHSGWEWSNPVPQGNTLRALDFAGETGYAAGDFGTLLKTEDGGQTWLGLRSGTTEDLSELEITGPLSLVVAGGCVLRRSDDGGTSFRRLRWTDSESRCDSPIAGIAFPDSITGFVLTEDGSVYRTDTGGEVWRNSGFVPADVSEDRNEPATGLFFADLDVGFATTRTGVYRTSNGGISWTVEAPRPGGFEGVHFPEPRVGYAVGRGGGAYVTTDGGLNWNPTGSSLSVPSLTLTSVRCADKMACLATTSSGNRLLRTVNGGASWSTVFLPDGAEALATAFTSPQDAIAAGSSGALVTSDDTGGSWSAIGAGLSGSFARLRGGSGYLAFAIGNGGALARTDDGGRSWTAIDVPTTEALVDVSFADATIGFALDLAGALYRTDDAGATWRVLGTGLDAQAVLALDGDIVLLVGPRGIRRSFDGGREFSREGPRFVRRAVLFGIDFAEGALFAYGPTSLFTSRDGGTTWRKLGRPDHRPLGAVDFVSPRVGFALGKGGRVWKTRNRGRSWRELAAAGTDGGIELSFSSELEGYIASNDLFFAKGDRRPDYLLRTVDGGTTWRPQLVSGSRDINSVLTTGESVDLLLAGGNRLFATTTGGDSGVRSSLSLSSQRRRFARPRTITLRGRLTPADGGEQVIVSGTEADPRRRHGAVDWRFKTARVRSDGRFVSTWRVRRTAVFVAQWTGDDVRRGAGSRVLKVTVRNLAERPR
jgi:photosystem II stability/assembly factor-like uncharacterized protein